MLYGTTNVKTQVENYTQLEYKIVQKAYQLKIAVIQTQQWLTDISATRDQDGLNDGFDEAAKQHEQFTTLLAEMSQIDSKNSERYTSMNSAYETYYTTGKKMAAYAKHGPAGGNQLMGTFDTAAEALRPIA